MASWCQLSDSLVFHYGGHNGAVNNFTYIVNNQQKTVEKRANSNNQRYNIGGCTYYKDFIYVFCGQHPNGSAIAVCEKYDINKNEWAQFNNFPCASVNMTSIQHLNGIAVTGYTSGRVYNYIPEEDKYFEMNVSAGTYHKILCKGGGKLFLFESGKLWEYQTEWNVILPTTNIANCSLLSYIIRDGENIYFLLSDNGVFRFNFISNKVEKIDTIAF